MCEGDFQRQIIVQQGVYQSVACGLKALHTYLDKHTSYRLCCYIEGGGGLKKHLLHSPYNLFLSFSDFFFFLVGLEK
jgi:hypothetical protein